MRVRAARGAIRVTQDESESVLEATRRLLTEILERNEVATEDLVSILFTATADLTAAFPAEAARQLGLGLVPLLCARELQVKGSMPGVVRVLLHFHTDRDLGGVEHVYLDGAESLRDDLA
ncbi:MAG: chorismate mutase [Actinomycetota bacterium]